MTRQPGLFTDAIWTDLAGTRAESGSGSAQVGRGDGGKEPGGRLHIDAVARLCQGVSW